jgi:hypothetical protein
LAEILTTNVPRCGSTRSSPISESLMKASRTGWRLTLSRPAMSCSDSAVAGSQPHGDDGRAEGVNT